jgi:hypothetical protein
VDFALTDEQDVVNEIQTMRPRLQSLAVLLVFTFILMGSAVTFAQASRSPRRLPLSLAQSRSKWLAQHVCEDIDSPAPCHAVGVDECQRLGPRKVDCDVTVRFTNGDDCIWTMHVFYKHGEVTQTEGRSEC